MKGKSTDGEIIQFRWIPIQETKERGQEMKLSQISQIANDMRILGSGGYGANKC